MAATSSKGLPGVRKGPKITLRPWHYHACTECGLRYADAGACATPLENGCCQKCRSGGELGRPAWDVGSDPQDCCREGVSVCTDNERERFNLGGTGPWFRCPTCSRTHPYDPRRKET